MFNKALVKDLMAKKGLTFDDLKKILCCEEQSVGYSFCLCKTKGGDCITTLLYFVVERWRVVVLDE